MELNSIYKKIMLACLFFISCNICYAQHSLYEKQLEKGIEAFQNFEFEKAITFLKPLETEVHNFEGETKSTLSFVLATCYHEIGDNEKAWAFYRIVHKYESSDSKIVMQIRPILLSICSEKGDTTAANEYLREMLSLMENPTFIASGFYSDYAIAICNYYVTHCQYEKVIAIAEKGLDVIDSEHIREDLKCLQKNSLYNILGNANRALANYEQAVVNYKNALHYISFTQQDRCDVLSIIGNCYELANIPDSAVVYLEEAERLYQLKGKPLERVRVLISLDLGVNYSLVGESLKAQKYLLAAESGLRQLNEFSLLPYVYSYLYLNSKNIGDKTLTDKYSKLIQDYIKYTKNDNSRDYRICYSTYASILESEGKCGEALAVMRNLTEMESLSNEIPTNSLAISYYSTASICIKLGNLIKAEKDARKSIELLENIKYNNKDLYIHAKLLLSEILSKTGRIGEAISNIENIKPFVATVVGHDDVISEYYNVMSELYSIIGYNDKILEYSIESSKNQLINKGGESYDYALSLLNLYEAYGVNNQNEKADECLNAAADIIIKLYGEDSKEYYKVIHKKALKLTYDSSKAIEGEKAFKKCLTLSEKCFGKNSTQYGEGLCWYAMFMYYSKHDKQGVELMQQGLEILSSFEGGTDDILYFLHQLCTWCHISKDYELAYTFDKKYYSKVKEYLSKNLPNLVDWQRESLWTPIHTNLSYFLSAASETDSSSYLKLAYNSLLLGKGLLLQSSNNISSAIQQSGDFELRNVHERIHLERSRLLNAANQNEIETIKENIYSLQREELNRLSNTEIFGNLLGVEWTDVCDNLKEGDVAIEFVSFPTQDCNSYIALVLNSHSHEPLCIPLFNDKELKRYVIDDNVGYDYQSSDLYRVIWDRLETYALRNAKNVYFAPDGLLHKIAIESLVDKQGIVASDKWNLHRVTSTRDLVLKSETNTHRTAALFGALNYNSDTQDEKDNSKTRGAVNGFDTLEETKREIEEINNQLDNNNVSCQVLTNENGTEQAFNGLSSTDLHILHLATHGFFLPDERENDNDGMHLLKSNREIGESALLRSGLILSAYNTTLEEYNNVNKENDGVLTAYEISALDFNNLDIVVLSACQTALGEIRGDGVFGLQRGFKLAGANSILMSLWKVDDAATCKLMTEFYSNWIGKKMTKHDALEVAKKTVRETKGWEDPKYWAAFILLDGLD